MASILNVILRISGQNTAGGAITSANQGLELLQQGLQAVNSTVVEFARQGFAFNASLESTTLQFKTLMGSADEAQKHVADLFKLGAETPFETGEIIQASRSLEVFGGAALDTHDNLVLIGDAAAATSAPFAELGNWTGRLYSALQAGRPFGDAAQRLQELAVLSPKARAEMEDLQKAGASADKIWAVFTADMGRFTGAMKEQAATWEGLSSTFHDTLAQLSGTAMHDSFLVLEADLKRVNAQLADPRVQHQAEQTSRALGVLTQVAVNAGEQLTTNVVTPLARAADNVDQMGNVIADRGVLMSKVLGGDLPAALHILQADLDVTRPAIDDTSDAFGRMTDNAERTGAAIDKGTPIYQQARDDWAELAHAADTAALAVGGYRDESYRAATAQQILNQQLEDARMAAAGAGDLFTRHPGLDMGVLTGGDLSGIDAIMQKQQEAARAAEAAARDQERAAREAARAEAQAARGAATAQRQAAREAERAWTQTHTTTAAGAQHTAAVQVAAAQAVVDATLAMQQQLTASYGSASGGLLQDTGSQANRTRIYGMTLVQPTIVTTITNHGPVGVDDLGRQITDTVNAGLRSGSVRVPGLSTR